jgi:hypothetical protein
MPGRTKGAEDPAAEGVVLRPEVRRLRESALVPESNVVRPAPTTFTHQLTEDTPFYLDGGRPGRSPDGTLTAGTPVVVAGTHGDRYRVVDGRGLAVDVPRDHLEEAVTRRLIPP